MIKLIVIFFSDLCGIVNTISTPPSDFRGCDPNRFYNCENKLECIPKVWTCDGTKDCSDGSDENRGKATLSSHFDENLGKSKVTFFLPFYSFFNDNSSFHHFICQL